MPRPEIFDANRPESQITHPDEMLGFLRRWEAHPPGGDFRIRAYSEAKQEEITSNLKMFDLLLSCIENRNTAGKNTTPQQACYLARDAAQYILYEDNKAAYEELSRTKLGWQRGFRKILLDHKDQFLDLFSSQEILTVVPDRMIGAKLYLALHAEVLDSPINILDIGTGNGAGLDGLVTNRIHHTVTSHLPGVDSGPEKAAAIDPRIARHLAHVNNLINTKLLDPIEFGLAVGTDKIDPSDSSWRKWRLACLRPGELLDDEGGVRSQLEELENDSLSNIAFHKLDITDDVQVDRFQEIYPKPFDVVTINTVLDYMKEAERIRAIANACKLGRRVLMQSFCYIIGDFSKVSSGLAFFDDWIDDTYRLHAIDTMAPRYPHQIESQSYRIDEILRWTDGRCREVLIAPSATSMGG